MTESRILFDYVGTSSAHIAMNMVETRAPNKSTSSIQCATSARCAAKDSRVDKGLEDSEGGCGFAAACQRPSINICIVTPSSTSGTRFSGILRPLLSNVIRHPAGIPATISAADAHHSTAKLADVDDHYGVSCRHPASQGVFRQARNGDARGAAFRHSAGCRHD